VTLSPRFPARHAPALACLTIAAGIGLVATPTAQAVPAFARKYGTSCATCHTIFPKLNPFGEAFRRNGYRFPGKDSDNVQAETVPMSQEAYKKLFPHALWPSRIMASIPIAVGFNGAATLHPDKHSAAAEADNKTIFTLQDLTEEGQLWAAGSFTDYTTFFGELAFSEDGVEVEHGAVQFGDLFGRPHWFNLWVGKMMPNYTSFGMHSTYLADMALPMVMVASLYGAPDETWSFAAAPAGVELNGMFGGRFSYAIGLNAGKNADVRYSNNVYAHLGFKLGGLRLDGEGGQTVVNAKKPWEETALTVDVLGYFADSFFTNMADEIQQDKTLLGAGSVRAQWRSLELNSGVWFERHNNAFTDGGKVGALVQYDELSYVIFPWLVPAARFEYVRLAPTGHETVQHMNLILGIDALVYANLKLQLAATIEMGKGSPMPDGWMMTGAIAPDPGVFKGEVESITLGLSYAL